MRAIDEPDRRIRGARPVALRNRERHAKERVIRCVERSSLRHLGDVQSAQFHPPQTGPERPFGHQLIRDGELGE